MRHERGDLVTSSKCICGEINARHCPVHNEPKPREWFIGWPDGENLEEVHDANSGGVHVIERSALAFKEAELAGCQEANEDLRQALTAAEREIARMDALAHEWQTKFGEAMAELESARGEIERLAGALEKCRIIKVDGHTFESEVARAALAEYDKLKAKD
jgi:hypothetical protein